MLITKTNKTERNKAMRTRDELLWELEQECSRRTEEAGGRWNSNHGVFRVATHGDGYAYLSNFYGWAMSTVDPANLTDEQLEELLEYGMCYCVCRSERPFLFETII